MAIRARTAFLAGLAIAGILPEASGQARPAPAAEPAALERIGADLDRDLFGAYNACDLGRFGALLAEDIEFYHDQSGLMRGARELVAAVERNICGKVRRELVAGSLETFPLHGYGIVQLGRHRFCEVGSAKCGGAARFVHLWHESGGRWRLARVVSYDHRALP